MDGSGSGMYLTVIFHFYDVQRSVSDTKFFLAL